MLQRHANELMSRLEQVYTVGATRVTKEELRLWYENAERINVRTWRDIQARWSEIVGENSEQKLMVGDGEGEWVFIWAEGLEETEASWFKDLPVRSKADSAE